MNDYQDYEEWKQWNKASFGTWSKIEAAYFSAELRRAGITPCKGIRIYELGFGHGEFAGYVMSLGCEYFGSEVNETLLEWGRGFGLNVTGEGIKDALKSDQTESLDAIIAFDVLEHLDIADIKAFLSDALKFLKPSGIVLARIPSGDSPFGRAIFHGDITHRTALGSSAVRQLSEQTGFEVMDIGPSRLPILGVGSMRTTIRRCGVRLAQSIVAKLINLVFHDNQSRVITACLVFVLRKPVS